MLQWYLEEKEGVNGPRRWKDSTIQRILSIWREGRKVGLLAVEKILGCDLTTTNASKLLEERSAIFVVLDCLIRIEIEADREFFLLEEERLRQVDQIESNLFQLRNQITKKATEKLRNSIADYVRELGLESYASTVERFLCWCRWALLEVALKAYAGEPLSEIAQRASFYLSDFHRIGNVLKNHLRRNIILRFREIDYFTYPIREEKRLWVDATVQILEMNPNWLSKGSSF